LKVYRLVLSDCTAIYVFLGNFDCKGCFSESSMLGRENCSVIFDCHSVADVVQTYSRKCILGFNNESLETARITPRLSKC